jgi:hypothetical protein
VSEEKLVLFLQEEVLERPVKKRRRTSAEPRAARNSDRGGAGEGEAVAQTLSYSSIDAYVSAVANL